MATRIDMDFILNYIDGVRQDWSQQSRTTSTSDREFIEAIQELFNNCKQALIQLSTFTGNNEQMKENQQNAERIVSKLKELKHTLDDRFPQNIENFPRDAFNVGSYHVEVVEFFYPVPFYSIISALVKLCRWSVYNSNGLLVCTYHLGKSEPILGNPHYILDKFYQNGHVHALIKPYGSTVPSYDQMKSHVIDDLTGQGPSPLISLTIY